MIEYLDEQNRLTRTMIVGTGIVEGFQPSVIGAGADQSLNLSNGFGLSSDGYLFYFQQTQLFNRFQAVTLKKDAFNGDEDLCPDGAKTVKDPTNGGAWEVYEVGYSDGSGNGNGGTDWSPLSELPAGREYSIVLYWYKEETDSDALRCFSDTNTEGSRVNFCVRPLLVPSDHLCDSQQAVGGGGNNTGIVAPPRIKRFGFKTSSNALVLEDITSLDIFMNRFRTVASEAIADIDRALNEADDLYGAGIGRTHKPFSGLAGRLTAVFNQFPDGNGTFDTFGKLGVQYFYDYLKDIIKAYHEFVDAASMLNFGGKIFPDPCLHPQHLILGTLTQVSGSTSLTVDAQNCKTIFRPSAFQEEDKSKLLRTQFLYDRLEALTKTNQYLQLPVPDSFNKINLIPSVNRRQSFGSLAVPYYYTPKSGVQELIRLVWDYSLSSSGREEEILGYHFLKVPHPLLFNIEDFDFFRLEGYIGQSINVVYEKIQKIRADYNLAFDVKCLKIGTQTSPSSIHQYLDEDLDLLYQKVRDDVVCSLEEMQDPHQMVPLISTKLKAFSYPLLANKYNSLTSSQQAALPVLSCNLPILENLYNTYQSRLDTFHLFHLFAKDHPGMEHLGGVPNGGTLILTYADRGAAGLQVVGDFALPYNCCSDKVGAVLPDPILLVGKAAVCRDDEARFEILVYPEDGLLFEGLTEPDPAQAELPVYILEDPQTGKYTFDPTLVLDAAFTDKKAEILLSYRANGKVSRSRITIYVRPQVSISTNLQEELIFENDLLVGKRLTFTGTAQDYENLIWRIAGEPQAAGNDQPEFTYEFRFSEGNRFEVQFVGKNEICTAVAKREVDLCDGIGPLSLTFDQNPPAFQYGKDQELEFTVSQRGGTFELLDAAGHLVEPELRNPDTGDLTRFAWSNENLTPGRYQLFYQFEPCQLSVMTEVTVEEAPIQIEPRTFCSDDPRRYRIRLNPDDAVLDVVGGVVEDGGRYYFVPSSPDIVFDATGMAEVVLTSPRAGGDPETLTITVFQVPAIRVLTPVPTFQNVSLPDSRLPEICLLTGYSLTFEPVPNIWESYDWEIPELAQNLNSDSTNSLIGLSLDFQTDQELTLRLKAGPPLHENDCTLEAMLTIPRICPSRVILAFQLTDDLADRVLLSTNANGIHEFLIGSGEVPIDPDPIGGQIQLSRLETDARGTNMFVPVPDPFQIIDVRTTGGDCGTTAYFLMLDIDPALAGRYRMRYEIQDCQGAFNTRDFVLTAQQIPLDTTFTGKELIQPASSLTPDQNKALLDRIAVYHTELDDIATDQHVPSSNAFKEMSKLMKESSTMDLLNTHFETAAKENLDKYDEASDTSKPKYERLFRTGFFYYLDQSVAAAPDQLAGDMETSLKEKIDTARRFGMDVDGMGTDWQGESLGLTAADAIKALFA